MSIYAGVGSREAPEEVLVVLEELGRILAERGWLLRSGNARGADQAFAKGAGAVSPELVEIFLSWPGYEKEAILPGCRVHGSPGKESREMASRYHSGWDICASGARALHGRNVEIILGPSLDSPVSLVLCWTAGGKVRGGTAMGIHVARAGAIPLVNLGTSAGMEFAGGLIAGDSVEDCLSVYLSSVSSFQRRLF